MMTYKFYKEHGIWFIQLKWFPKKWKHHLAMVQGADELLDKLSGFGDSITLEISTKPLRQDFIILNRVFILPTYLIGAVYEPVNINIEHEIIKKNQLWLCWVTLIVFGRYPKNIYFKIKINQ